MNHPGLTDPPAGAGVDAATAAQIAAADPARSTWLSANAGSGKTRVLTDRVARLLLAGTPPQNILCLTYTKAAAGEMQNRLFRRLGEWAMMPDAPLAEALQRIGVAGPIPAAKLARARTLFARAIETPGGLKIQTIHAFCAAILRQFPLEAGVSPGFAELDERQARLLRQQAFDELAEGPQATLLRAFARLCAPADLDRLLDELAKHVDAFLPDGFATSADEALPPAGLDETRLYGWYGLVPGEDVAAVRRAVLGGATPAAVEAIAAALEGGTAAQQRWAEELAGLAALSDETALETLDTLVLTQPGTLRDKLCKAVQKRAPELLEELEALGARLNIARSKLLALEELPRTRALYRFAGAWLGLYQQAKAARGVLDFDDLIRATLRLLSRSGAAAWVLYRLDGGIDHILVDEAQDTSPQQWQIIEALAQEFTAGAGAREALRTIFAVGDRKQSIYSFQGADPAGFERMREHFAHQLRDSGAALQERELHHSFRSSPLILRLVDRIFDGSRPRGTGGATTHLAWAADLPGRVDLWPLLQDEDGGELPEWHDAGPRTSARAGALQLAERLADEVARMLAEEQIPDDKGSFRPLTPGDILVLVRRRSFISDPLILALKQRGVAVAGADQIELTAELAVMDVVAVLKVLVTPADSLSLAAALRSPLFGLDESELCRLAAGRAEGETLWQALETSGRHPQAVELLEDLRRQADFLRPHELIARLLVRHEGRQRLRARLGDEVDEALDVLLQQAMAYETGAVPSLTGFLAWHEAGAEPVKRQADGAGDNLRVMTVHGAKGLEAPVVILPDTADHTPPVRQHLVVRKDGFPLMRMRKEQRPDALMPLFEAEAVARDEEADRLFYVALTRPRSWLIVCGAGDDKAAEKGRPSWHRQVADGLAGMAPQEVSVQGTSILRAETGAWPPSVPQAAAVLASAPAPLPAWARTAAEPGPPLPRLLTPSALAAQLPPGPLDTGAAPAMPVPDLEAGEEARAAAQRHGTALHLLLEHLPLHPRVDWPELAEALLAAGEEPLLSDEVSALLAEAQALLDAPDLRWLFEGEALAEVDLTTGLPVAAGVPPGEATAGGELRLLGRVDRLIARPDGSWLVVDFKSSATPPERPEQIPAPILAQMGAYLAALARIAPGRQVEAAILWTRTARLMPVPPALAQEALTRALAAFA